jgi:hypothetical protein
MTSEEVAMRRRATLVRINTREAHGPRGTLGFAAGALESLKAINDLLSPVSH